MSKTYDRKQAYYHRPGGVRSDSFKSCGLLQLRTMQEVGNMLGISRERVLQIECRAFQKIREQLPEFVNNR